MTTSHRPQARWPLERLLSTLLLVTPVVALGSIGLATQSRLLLMGATGQLFVSLLLVPYRAVWRSPSSGTLALAYLIALGWLHAATRLSNDPAIRLTRGGLLGVALVVAVGHDLARTGLGPRRRAVELVRKLQARRRWPGTPEEITRLPEVAALGGALKEDAAPAAAALTDPRPEVRVAVLSALALRPWWRANEAELLLETLRRSPEPEVRAAAVGAFRNVGHMDAVLDVTAYLRDKSPEVRRATLAALIGGDANRWPLVRDAVRDALADPGLAHDGPIEERLCALAAVDLSTWASEPEPLATRSVKTLVTHYAGELRGGTNLALPAEVARQVLDSQSPPLLRVELAGLLRDTNRLTPELLDRMTDSDQPGPLRLLAAEILLGWNPHDPDAIDVLRGLGRQSNRETALVIARLLQDYLRVEVGLPHMPLSAGSKQAAEVARRVFTWATARQTPGSDQPQPAARLAGLRDTGTIPVPYELR